MKLFTLCYIKKDNKTLMLKVNKPHSFHHGFYNGLGGKFESTETPEECVIREVREESGLTIKDPTLKGRITFVEENGPNNGHVYIFVTTRFEGQLKECDEGKLEWIDDSLLGNLHLHEGDKRFLPWLEQDKFFSAKFVYDGQRLLSHKVTFY